MGDRRAAATPLLTLCILKQVKICHENALFLHKIFKNFWQKKHSPLPRPYPYPFAPFSKFLDLAPIGDGVYGGKLI